MCEEILEFLDYTDLLSRIVSFHTNKGMANFVFDFTEKISSDPYIPAFFSF